MRPRQQQIITGIFCLFITIVVLLLSYKIALLTQNLTPQQQNALDYINTQAPLEGQYTEAERSHMADVQRVVQRIDLTFYLALSISAGIILYYRKQRNILKKLVQYASITTATVTFLFLLLAVLFFDYAFTAFHAIFFPQGNWQFPVDSLLIQTFPTEFFATMGIIIFSTALILSSVLYVVTQAKKFIRE